MAADDKYTDRVEVYLKGTWLPLAMTYDHWHSAVDDAREISKCDHLKTRVVRIDAEHSMRTVYECWWEQLQMFYGS